MIVRALPIAILATSLFYTPIGEAQTVWYVDDDGDLGNSCTSWPDACPELQTALSLAGPGDQVWIAIGTYKPDAVSAVECTSRVAVPL